MPRSSSVVPAAERILEKLTSRMRALGALAVVSLGLSTVVVARDSPAHARRIGLVLGGDGAKGLAHLGVLQVLQEASMPIDVVPTPARAPSSVASTPSATRPLPLERTVTVLDRDDDLQDAAEHRFARIAWRIDGLRTQLTLPIRDGKPQLPVALIAGQRIQLLLSRFTGGLHSSQRTSVSETSFNVNRDCLGGSLRNPQTGQAGPCGPCFLSTPDAIRNLAVRDVTPAAMFSPPLDQPGPDDGRWTGAGLRPVPTAQFHS